MTASRDVALIDARATCLDLAFTHAKATGDIGNLDAVLATAEALFAFIGRGVPVDRRARSARAGR